MSARARQMPVPQLLASSGRERVVIENISPLIDCGRFAVKRIVGEQLWVEADCFADSHDLLACVIKYRHDDDAEWRESAMAAQGNDRWRAAFTVDRIGVWRFGVVAWIDTLRSWAHDFARRIEPADVRVAARAGADLIAAAARRATAIERAQLEAWAGQLREEPDAERLHELALDAGLMALASLHARRNAAVRSAYLRAVVDRPRARFSTWYEMFPRSCAREPGLHGTFDDVCSQLDYIAQMGFDVLYLPPIHPIGRERRKGRNNAVVATAADVGSPWAIGSDEGDHKAVHPQLGTHAEFRRLLEAARGRGIEIALDFALQCAPDHPYVSAHPQWFRRRADGSVQYAENPPKKYQDIYPFNFESDDWQALWHELRDIITFWIGQGVVLFRVDNPHTKPFAFWQWVIAETKREHPDVLFLSEAFTRPKVMHRLAKLGFSQSYTYFTWRQTKRELTEYFTELAHGPGREYFRPNCWPNTPDILPAHLQSGGTPEFALRLVLAATLAANYGIYGPAFELKEHIAREPGSEEYLNSEKYEIRNWERARADSLAAFIGRVNRIRHSHEALQSDGSLHFHPVDNDMLICYSKAAPGQADVILTVVNLDHRYVQSGWIDLDLAPLALAPGASYEVHDLLSGARYSWHGSRNFVRLDPAVAPAHIFHLPGRAPSAVSGQPPDDTH